MYQVVADEGLHIPKAGGTKAADFQVRREPSSKKALTARRATQNKHTQQIPAEVPLTPGQAEKQTLTFLT